MNELEAPAARILFCARQHAVYRRIGLAVRFELRAEQRREHRIHFHRGRLNVRLRLKILFTLALDPDHAERVQHDLGKIAPRRRQQPVEKAQPDQTTGDLPGQLLLVGVGHARKPPAADSCPGEFVDFGLYLGPLGVGRRAKHFNRILLPRSRPDFIRDVVARLRVEHRRGGLREQARTHRDR